MELSGRENHARMIFRVDCFMAELLLQYKFTEYVIAHIGSPLCQTDPPILHDQQPLLLHFS